MRNIIIAGAASLLMLTACEKQDSKVAEKSLEQQKIEFQAKQLEIERQKLAIDKEKMQFEMQKRADSLAALNKRAAADKAAAAPQVIRETKSVYVGSTPKRSPSKRSRSYASTGNTGASGTSASSGTTAGSATVAPAAKKGISSAAKGTIIGTVGGAAAGAIIGKKNPGAGAVIGGILGGATGYTIGRSKDRKSGRVPRAD